MTKGGRSLAWSPVPLWPPLRSRRTSLKIQRRENASSTHKCGWRVLQCSSVDQRCILVATCVFHLDLQSVSSFSLFIVAFTIFSNFLGPKLLEQFWHPKHNFFEFCNRPVAIGKGVVFEEVFCVENRNKKC